MTDKEQDKDKPEFTEKEIAFFDTIERIREFFAGCLMSKKRPTLGDLEQAGLAFNHLFGLYPYENQSLVAEIRRMRTREALEICASQAEQYRDELMDTIKELEETGELDSRKAIDAFVNQFTRLVEGARTHAANLP